MSVIVITPLSSGKDSQAAWLWAKEKFKNVVPAFCDVGWENWRSYLHLQYLMKKSGDKLLVLKSKEYDGMADLARKKKQFPSSRDKFCTVELKIYPMIDYVLSLNSHILIIDGVRADESERRSNMQAECRFFKYYFEPYESNELIVKRFELNPPKTVVQEKKLNKAKQRLAAGYKDEKYFTYRKEEVMEWCKKYDDSIFRPFFSASAQDVIDFSVSRGYKLNPLYYLGHKRVGCSPCVNDGPNELQIYLENDPTFFEDLYEIEQELGFSFFRPDDCPKRYHSEISPSGKTYPNALDMKRYIIDRSATKRSVGKLFEGQKSCNSFYNLCE